MRWTENWLNSQAQKVVISDTKSGWRPETGSIPEGLILGPTLFNTFINGVDDGEE